MISRNCPHTVLRHQVVRMVMFQRRAIFQVAFTPFSDWDGFSLWTGIKLWLELLFRDCITQSNIEPTLDKFGDRWVINLR